ncbi:MAG: FAD-binding protein, partial [Planctomycetota bacterium]|nr:FAD-binding protein [Planctomycetota bacterium]
MNEPLSQHCWNKLGGPAECLIDIDTEDELVQVLTESHAKRTPVRVLGLGSNLLVSEDGVPGVVIRLKGEFADFSFDGETMHAGGGTDLRKIIPESVRRGLDGLWQLAGFPATIGGALAMNAGGRWGEISDNLVHCSG